MRSDLVYCIHLIYSIHVIYLVDGKVIYPFIIIYPFTPNPCSYARHPSSAAPAAAPAGTKGACTFWILLVIPTIYKAYFSGLCKRISPKNMALYGTVPPF